MSAAPAPIESPDLATTVEFHVDTVLAVMTEKLGRAPSRSEEAKWGELYQLVGAALLARAKRPRVEVAPVVEAAPEPVAAPAKPKRAKHRGAAPLFLRSHKANAPPTNPDPVPPGGMGSSAAPRKTADEVLANRPAKPPQRRRADERSR